MQPTTDLTPLDAFAQPMIYLLLVVGVLILAWQVCRRELRLLKERDQRIERFCNATEKNIAQQEATAAHFAKAWEDYFAGASDAPVKEKR